MVAEGLCLIRPSYQQVRVIVHELRAQQRPPGRRDAARVELPHQVAGRCARLRGRSVAWGRVFLSNSLLLGGPEYHDQLRAAEAAGPNPVEGGDDPDSEVAAAAPSFRGEPWAIHDERRARGRVLRVADRGDLVPARAKR